MKKKRKEITDKTRNINFAAAFHELKQRKIVSNQTELAKLMEVSGDTITNIMHYYNEVSEDTISKLQKAAGGIFNIHFLRGESDVMFAQDAGDPAPAQIDQSSLMNAAIAAKDETITTLKREIKNNKEAEEQKLLAKDETIAALREQLKTKEALIKSLQQQVENLQGQLMQQHYPGYSGYPYPTGVAEDAGKPTNKPTQKA